MSKRKKNNGFGKQQQQTVMLTSKQKQQRDDLGKSISITVEPGVDVFYREDGRFKHSCTNVFASEVIFGFNLNDYWYLLEKAYGTLADGYYFSDHETRKGNYLGATCAEAVDALVNRRLAKVVRMS